MSKDEMNGEATVSPIIVISVVIMFLSACIGGIVEMTGNKGGRAWEILGFPILISGIVIGIHMIVTKRAVSKDREYSNKEVVGVGVVYLILFLGALFCFMSGFLRD